MCTYVVHSPRSSRVCYYGALSECIATLLIYCAYITEALSCIPSLTYIVTVHCCALRMVAVHRRHCDTPRCDVVLPDTLQSLSMRRCDSHSLRCLVRLPTFYALLLMLNIRPGVIIASHLSTRPSSEARLPCIRMRAQYCYTATSGPMMSPGQLS